MRKFKIYMVLGITIIVLLSCGKNPLSDRPGEVYGTWKLTETLFDPGDGSGKYEKVKENKSLNLSKTGIISGDALPDLNAFRILDSVRMEVTLKANQTILVYRYKATANMLTLNPPCIEGCGYRFIRR
ncbi:hypothetical protein [Pedobacter sandarakinus]|uniref:hypothetical protein n=1 Tax=Pedobacter sandarakinus TaxID=353156 RepID=UPI00224755F8|nr:hypothetical protein [Pedobacter sandarakinus]MCX2574574.1 hypothetical protein [Pedobacter sandarakinus]